MTSTVYNRFGKQVQVTDSVGTTQTFTDDRIAEPRDLGGTLTDSVGGTLTARYGPDAQILGMDLPGGIRLTTTLDSSGDPTARYYTRASDGILIATSRQISNIRGPAICQTYDQVDPIPGSANAYAYGFVAPVYKFDLDGKWPYGVGCATRTASYGSIE